jgi:hypothetical protein
MFYLLAKALKTGTILTRLIRCNKVGIISHSNCRQLVLVILGCLKNPGIRRPGFIYFGTLFICYIDYDLGYGDFSVKAPMFLSE